MKRDFYSDSISNFIKSSPDEIYGTISKSSRFSDELEQKDSWSEEIKILKETLRNFEGKIFFEYSIPRMGERADVVLIIQHAVFVLEFKVGLTKFLPADIEQVFNYALDLKNFHETSHDCLIAPVIIPTEAKNVLTNLLLTPHNDNLLFPISTRFLKR